MKLVEYFEEGGRSPFAAWFGRLDAIAAAKVQVSLTRLAGGNTSNLKSVGEGVFEQKIDFGPGYRVYLGREGDRLVILLGGGTKQRQQGDIADAIARWRDYKANRKGRTYGTDP